jgi:hypothetical protein
MTRASAMVLISPESGTEVIHASLALTRTTNGMVRIDRDQDAGPSTGSGHLRATTARISEP